MSVQDLALQRNKYKHLSDEEWRWFLQQVEGRERTADKLPTFAAIEDWWYPVRLSCEQCSSELTARYKASLVSGATMVDLTGGYGVDTYFLSERFAHTDYVEQNEELCRIAEHNFSLIDNRKSIIVHNSSAEAFLKTAGQYDLIFMDPARRDSHGGKVFRLVDCTPNVVELLPTLLAHGKRLIIKLSPMLDLTQAVKELSQVTWDVHIVAIKNEVKELLLVSGGTGQITAIDLAEPEKAFVYTKEQETNCPLAINPSPFAFIYEPNAAILKAGAYKLVAERFGLHKLDVNTHLYASDTLVENFPGRIWRIQSPITKNEVNRAPVAENHQLPISQANVLTRNYPLTPEQLKKKYRLKDGGDSYLIGCRVNGKPTLYTAERIN